MNIDFHTHTFPQRIAAKAIAGIQASGRSVAFTDGTREGLAGSMAESGIDLSVVLPVATNPAKLSSMNKVAIENNGKDGMICFGAMHPLAEDWRQQLEALAAAGIRGIKLHPQYQMTDIEDTRYLRILEHAGRLGLIVVIHAGDEIAYPGCVRCSPEQTARALAKVGPVTMVLAHMGGWKNWDRVLDSIGPTGAHVDTALSLGSITPLPDAGWKPEELQLLRDEEFCHMVDQLGAERVLFGTDSPWGHQGEDLQRLRSLPLTDEQKAMILGENAARLLKL